MTNNRLSAACVVNDVYVREMIVILFWNGKTLGIDLNAVYLKWLMTKFLLKSLLP